MNQKKFYKIVQKFIDAGYLTEIFKTKQCAIFKFGNVIYVASDYMTHKNEAICLAVSAEQAEKIIANKDYLSRLVVEYGEKNELASRSLAFSKETFEKCDETITLLREQYRDTVVNHQTEQNLKQAANKYNESLKNTVIELLNERNKYLKKFKPFAIVALVLMVLQITAWLTKDFRDSFNPVVPFETFDKTIEETGVYSSVEFDFVAPLRTYVFKPSYDRTEYYLFGNSETQQYGLLSEPLFFGETEKVEEEIEKKGYYKGKTISMYGHTGHILTVSEESNSSYYDDDKTEEAIALFSEHLFPIDASAGFGNVCLEYDSYEPEREVLFINFSLNIIFLSFAFIAIIIGFFVYGSKADSYAQKLNLMESQLGINLKKFIKDQKTE